MGVYKRYYSQGMKGKRVRGVTQQRGGLGPTAVRVDVFQSADIRKVLQEFEGETRNKALKRGLRKAGTVVARRARQLVPKREKIDKDTGLAVPLNKWQRQDKPLKNMISTAVRTPRGNKPGAPVGVWVGPRWEGQGKIAHIVEGYPQGTEATPRHFSHGQQSSAMYLYPQPFMRPAADETKSQQQKALLDELIAQAKAAGPGPLK